MEHVDEYGMFTKFRVSLERIDNFIQDMEGLLNDGCSDYLVPHVKELLKAARQKRVEYDSILNQ